MSFSFDYSSRRAQKARIGGVLGRRSINLLMNTAIALLVVVGCGLMFTGTQGGAVIVAFGAIIVLIMFWYHGDLKKQDATLLAGDTLALDRALDKYVLARLPKNPNVKNIWQSVKGHWHQDFFRVRYGIDNVYMETQLEGGQIAPDVVWSLAVELTHRYDLPAITPGAVVVALFLSAPAADQLLNTLHLERQELESGLAWLKQLEETFDHVRSREQYGGLGRDWANGYTPLLSKMAHNVSLDIQHGRLFVHATPSREQVAEQMLAVLSKSSSGSVALVGEFGAGKTTAVLVLAQKLLTQKVPSLRYHQIFNLDASVLIANAGNFQSLEELVLRLMSEANRAGNVILFLDEAQLFMKTGTGSMDLTNILLQVLQSGRIHLICALTPIEWQHIQTNNTALAALMHQLVLPPAERGEALQIMQDQLLLIEHKHKVVFTFQAIQEAYRLAEKYIHEQAFPGRGIQLLEESAVFSGGGLVTPEVVGKSLESKLGVKVVAATATEGQQLLHLEDELHKQLINQVRAVSVVANALRRARSGVGNPNRPVGSFLFLGPTGVGKTELAKALADVYFHGRDQVIRINLNEYTRAADAARLLAGGTEQSSGGMLDAIRRQPYSVVLLDEIEKAHPDVLNLFLQLLDEGILKDANGRDASFKDAIVIATSNAGADMIRAHIDAGQDLEQFEDEFVNKLIDQNLFKPEFLNRFDEIVLFRPLKPEELNQVVQLMISEVNQTLERQKVRVALSELAISWLVERGNDPRLGARPMRRMIQRSVENIVAKKLLEGSAGPGSEIMLDVSDLEQADQA